MIRISIARLSRADRVAVPRLLAALWVLATGVVISAEISPESDPLERLRMGGWLTIAIPQQSLAPFVIHGAEPVPAGLDPALGSTLANTLGVDVEFLLVPNGTAGIVDALSEGRALLGIGHIIATPELARRVALSSPYARPGRALLFHRLAIARSGTTSRGLLLHTGTRVAVLDDPSNVSLLRLTYPRLHLEPHTGLDAAGRNLLEGRQSLFIAGEPQLQHWLSRHPRFGLTLGFRSLPDSGYKLVIALSLNARRLLGWLDDTLQILETDGTLEALRQRHLSVDSKGET